MSAKPTPPWRRMVATISSPFRHAVALLRDVASQADLSIDDQSRWNDAIGGLLIAVVRADGRETAEELEQVEEIFTLQFGKREARRVKEAVELAGPRSVAQLCETLRGLSAEDREEMVRAMLEMAIADERISSEELKVVREAAGEFGFGEEAVERFRGELEAERAKRSAIVKSGAGIAVALAVIGVFVFTATFLKSVLFGLILAYLFWPLQRFFQHRFFPHPWIQQALRLFHGVAWPIHYLVGRLKQFFATGRDEHEVGDGSGRVSQACHATLVTVLGGAALAFGLFVWASSGYVASVGRFVADSQREASQGPQVEPVEASDVQDDEMPHGLLDEGLPWLERFRPRLARSAILQTASEVAEEYLTNEEKRKELAIAVFQNLQPVVIRAGGMVAMTGGLLLDGLMTVFFFSFFLQRIASGQSREGGLKRPTGQYLIETIFDSGWLPNVSESARREGQLIIDEILGMLKTWLRGYLWIIAIDTVLYSLLFMVLGIPYWPVLGLIAGMTVLLPFVGPIFSCALTLVVTYSLYSESVTLLATIVVSYVVINGVIEQLILYPALVGEALGLNALETIIIVLLGGLVSGLAGAVFAVPVAAILKQLIPKIYQALGRGPEPAG